MAIQLQKLVDNLTYRLQYSQERCDLWLSNVSKYGLHYQLEWGNDAVQNAAVVKVCSNLLEIIRMDREHEATEDEIVRDIQTTLNNWHLRSCGQVHNSTSPMSNIAKTYEDVVVAELWKEVVGSRLP